MNLELVIKCKKIIEDAENDLGKDLSGSKLDLVADNIPQESLENLCKALRQLGYDY